jgi:hypothetical protein
MKRTLGIAATCAAVLMLTSVAGMEAKASYLGYGNGDPGNWDFWTEQHSGSAMTGQATNPTAQKHYAATGGGCGYLHHKAVQTGSDHWWHRYNECMKG